MNRKGLAGSIALKVLLPGVLLLGALSHATVELPGEGQTKPALAAAPFPTRLHQFVWRNWTVVPKERLAMVVGSTPAALEEIAASMGLPAQSTIDPLWQDKGYITVIRRNWHLLPYEQLMQLLGFSRERLRYALMEDDFLWVKLGRLKPTCEPLRYQSPNATEEAAARQIAQWLREEGVPELLQQPEEPRFAFLKRFEQADPQVSSPKEGDDSPFALRYIFSYCADYGDPLSDPAVSSYPAGLLQQLAAAGVNGIWVHSVLSTLAKDPVFSEFGKGCEQRMEGLRTLIERAGRYGIKVFLYLNEPRTVHTSFFAVNGRAQMRGVEADGDTARLCTTHPEVRRWMSESLHSVFQKAPGLGGIFTITASENPTSCASHRQHAQCPHCRERDYAEIIAEVNATLAQGVWRADPEAKVIVWDWGWDDQHAAAIIERLPQQCWFQSVSEWSLPIERGGVKSAVGEYSISAVGPGPRAQRHWELARKAGLKTVAKVQVGATWEFSAIPYLPTLDLVAQHAARLTKAGIDGVMLSWSLGCYPSPNLEVFQAFSRTATDYGAVLDRVALQRYGQEALAPVRRAWQAFSEGFGEFPYHIRTLYNGPQHMGPANPLYAQPTGYRSTMVGLPYDDLKSWCGIYPAEVWIAQMEKVREGCAHGCRKWQELLPMVSAGGRSTATAEWGLFRALELHFASCVNQARFIVARDDWLAATTAERRTASREAMHQALQAELASAKALLPLVRSDSRIGYESSNHYFYLPQDLLEKLINCRSLLAQ